MKKVELNIIALANSESSKGNFVLVLEEHNGLRRIPITVGSYEAQAIAVPLEKMQPTRPLTHDLLKNTIDSCNIRIEEILIGIMDNGIFNAVIVGKKPDKSNLEIDARASDAIALAVRIGCPIYTTEAVLKATGIVMDQPSKAFLNKRGQLEDYSRQELEKLLRQVLAKEDYESASKIRDALKSINDN